MSMSIYLITLLYLVNSLRGGRNVGGDAVEWKPQILDGGRLWEAVLDAFVHGGSREQAGDGIGQVAHEVERFGHVGEPVRGLLGHGGEVSVEAPQSPDEGSDAGNSDDGKKLECIFKYFLSDIVSSKNLILRMMSF